MGGPFSLQQKPYFGAFFHPISFSPLIFKAVIFKFPSENDPNLSSPDFATAAEILDFSKKVLQTWVMTPPEFATITDHRILEFLGRCGRKIKFDDA